MIPSPSRKDIQEGDFVEVRGKPWLVEALVGDDGDLPACERVLGLEAGRLIASGDDGVPDVRLTTSFAVVAVR